MKRLRMSRYRLIAARIYSSGLSLCIIRCVSKMINKEKRNAPPTDIALYIKALGNRICKEIMYHIQGFVNMLLLRFNSYSRD